METTQQRFQQAVQILKRGERENARRILRQILLDEPTYAPAWLWMSALVEDSNQQRECLLRTLELDPDNESARKGLEILDLQTFVESIPPEQSELYPTVAPAPRQVRKLGEYLVGQGLITQEQLDEALETQRELQSSQQGIRVPLGDVLLKLNMLSPQLLATALVGQQQEKIEQFDNKTPEYLGEYLITRGIITQDQLKEVLAVQMKLRQKGKNMLLGELMVRAGYVTPTVLESVLNQQLDDIFNRFDDENKEEE
jgi:hypothetical protein